MQVEFVQITQVKEASYNPRTMAPEMMEKLKKSIQEFKVYSPLIVNKQTECVVGGNQRLKALIELGHEKVHVVWVDLSLEKEKLLNIELNKISGEWDFEKLAQILDELSKVPDLDVTDSGFSMPEISEIFDRYGEEPREDNYDFDEAVDSIVEPITKAGDVIELGKHKIMCADATIQERVSELLGVCRIDLYWSDWPYNVNYDAANRPGVKGTKWDKIQNDHLSEEKYIDWMRKVLTVTVPYLSPGCPVYIWNGHRQFWSMSQLFPEFGIHPACIITWAKPSFSPSWNDYQHATEFCLYGWMGNGTHPWYGKAETTLWEVKRDSAKQLVHPTQKPIELAQRAIRNSTKRDEIVFDSCLGSGSVLIAAESLGRCCLGFEIEPAYCDAIVRRYIAYVGADKVSEEIRRKYAQEVSHDAAK